ncbi:MAG: hypothetical protein A3A86_05445 [Elusimicrobia bacterium RIFCSPLOWO2_01_FULL_60_11]|nr:MAG: hypothetical protein A3A86_05445 [Elusimicrobia bacterium RIFCSPLOWO2_01_FULL_60_11]
MKKSILLLLSLSLSAPFALNADDASKPSAKGKWREYFGLEKTETREKISGREPDNPESMVDLVDVPTSNVLDYGGFRLNFRLYSEGGVQNHISFGVFRRLNIGASWDIERLLGSEEARTVAPALFVKFRVYDGSVVLPSLALGYDGQGRFYDRDKDEYRERERGLHAVFSKELHFPGLLGHAGANIAKFKDGEVFGFVGFSYVIENKVALLTEYDNIRKGPENRWNAGVRFFPVPSLAIDFAFRRIASRYDKERIIRINWVGTF